jgi:hypothetical protein
MMMTTTMMMMMRKKKKEEALDHTLWRTPLWKGLWTFRKTDDAIN